MVPIAGFTLLLLVFSINAFLLFLGTSRFFPSLSSAVNKAVNTVRNQEKIFLLLSCLSFVSAVSSQLCLIYSFVTSDYSVLNVYQNSHHLKPLIYKISGSWGNHEGSMLLLISILSLYSFAFVFLSKIDAQKKVIIAASQSGIIALFAAFTAFTSNPFLKIFPTPSEGLGLNPILQDIGLALHPPMLYTGYIGFALIFSFAIAALLSEKIDRDFAKFLKPWLFFCYGFLTLGIGLGAWWAYRELGWGGYWFWDPVENVSLMPWLAATALIHCVKVLERQENFKIWTVLLAILTFILCLVGLFLVRSGVLTSVHSFAVDAKRGFFVIGLILLIGGSGLLLFGAKVQKLKPLDNKHRLTTNNLQLTTILLNNYFLVIALFTVLLGTLYPIFSRSFFGQFIAIGPDYYNKIFSILLIPFLVFLGVSYDLGNQEKIGKFFWLKCPNPLIILISAGITGLTVFYDKEGSFLQNLILFLAIFSLLKTVISEFSRKNFTMFLAHCGFCFIICGVVLSASFGSVKEVNLKKGESLHIADYELRFDEISYFAGKNFIARQGNFSILKNGQEVGKLEPQLRYYPSPEQTTNETSIKHGIFSDLYLVIGNKDEQENYAVRAYHKPFIWLIWLGCVMIFGGAFVQLIKIFYVKKSRNKQS